MPIGTTPAYNGPYTANGATTVFPFTFKVLSTSQVSVINRVSGVDTTVSSGLYTVTLSSSSPSSGSVVFNTAPASGEIYVLLTPEFSQDIEFADGAAWIAKPVNDGYDQSALRDQALKRDLGRAMLVPVGETTPVLPVASERAGQYLAYDTNGDPVMASGTGADSGLRADLASTATGKGAALVAIDAGANGYVVPSTVQKYIKGGKINVKALGAVGDGTLHPLSEFYTSLAAAQAVYPFATSLTQSIDWCAIQLAQLIAHNASAGVHPAIEIPAGKYIIDADIQCYSYTVMEGHSAGTSNSGPPTNGQLTRGYQTTFQAAAGYNGNMLLFNSTSQPGGDSISDTIIRRICFRGNWTGPGDATNTTGRAIYFNGVYLIQNSYIEECEFHNFAQEGVFCNVVPLPVRFRRLWGRMLGGAVVRINYDTVRVSHSVVFDDIQGDYVGATTITTDAAGNAVSLRAGLVLIDCSLQIGASKNVSQESWIFRDFKHEVDSGLVSNSAYAPDTIVLHSCDRSTAHVANVNVLTYDPTGGTVGTPVTNAIIRLTGTKTPFVTWSNCRMGTLIATTDYVLQDSVNSVNIDKSQRSGAYMAPVTQRTSTPNTTDIILSSRVRSESTGTADNRDRFSVTADGTITFTDGTAATSGDTNISRVGTRRNRFFGTWEARKLAARAQTALTNSAFALTGWGAGATIAVVNECTDGKGQISVTAGTAPSANPTIVLTYADTANAPYAVNPIAVANMETTSTGAFAHIATRTPNTTAMTMMYCGTPVASSTYVINYIIIG